MVADEVAPPGAPRLTSQTVDLLTALLRGDWAVAEAADGTTRAQASGVIAAYTQWHLERGLKSLNHLDRGMHAQGEAVRRAAPAPAAAEPAAAEPAAR
jgi:DNA repair protein RecO (recombination protein O)